jgi:lipopolysaccharide transport system permease protein
MVAASDQVAPPAPPPVTVIRPSGGWPRLDLAELWAYRELLYFFIWRDVKVRYKQTLLGAAWAILQPLLAMVVFTVFFGRMANIDSDGYPYPIFSYAALLPWTLFAQGVSQASNSLVGAQNLLKKVYFPRLLVPAASALAPVVDFVLACSVFLVLMARYDVAPTPRMLLLPALVALTLATSLGVGLWLSALNVRYRDVRHALPFFVQLWLFVTPVIYPTSKVVEKLSDLGLPGWLYGLNPMAGVVSGFRWALLGSAAAHWGVVLASAMVAGLLLAGGLCWFRRTERGFADLV